jgi:4-amino-4-deoxy-L-arabinose transferase-like glycosyltransferase
MRPTPIPALDQKQLAANPNLRAVVVEPAPAHVLYIPGAPSASPRLEPWSLRSLTVLFLFWAAIFLAASATPSLLDDADATHAQAAQAMLHTGDWVTLHVNGIRYLEKPPLPYWIAACSMRLFGENSFAIHLPLALTVLFLALLGYAWSRRAFSERAAFYTALFTLTAAGVFLFTRIFIPDALLSLLLALSIYAALRALDTDPSAPRPRSPASSLAGAAHPDSETWVVAATTKPGAPSIREADAWDSGWAYLMWAALACAVLTKGLVAIVFLVASVGAFLLLTGEWRRWRSLHPFTGAALFVAIAAPWHILAALRNPAVPMPANSGFPAHAGWTWFYLYNEHIARFLGTRVPRDYNKLPAALYWLLHIVWLFPWSLFFPAAIAVAWRERHRLRDSAFRTFAERTVLALILFSGIILGFFSLSTNQEYYTFPVYLPLLLLTAAAVAHIEEQRTRDPLTSFGTLTFAHAALTVFGVAIAAALAYGLWTSRHLAFVPDIGSLLAHRGVGDYTLSMSHFFDLTGPSFAALRLPAALAAIAFAIGPLTAWILRARRRPLASTCTIALTAATFLIAAHIALIRFAPMLSSRDFAFTIQQLESDRSIEPNTEVLLYGDQAYGSSIPFYLGHHVELVDGRSTSMLFGSLFPDAPHLFLTPNDLAAQWGHGPRKLLFVPLEHRDDVDRLLGPHQVLLHETSGKALLTDRPLDPSTTVP